MRVAILNSRQSKTPLGTDPWVQRTLAAVDWAVKEQNAGVVSSTDLITWDLVTWYALSLGAQVQLMRPGSQDNDTGSIERLVRDYGGESSRLELSAVDVVPGGRSRKSGWRERDRRVVEAADVLIPVSIRPGGFLQELLIEHTTTKTVERQFQTPYTPTAHHERNLLDLARLNDELRSWPDDYLIHWTRTCHGTWPGEAKREYLNDLVQSESRYCRSAIDTITRIVRERCIRASSSHIGSNQPMVAFTELSPIDSIALMRWRPRWSRWSFEPFGIAIPRALASERGARPVHYVASSDWDKLSAEAKPYCHSVGKEHPIWPAEKEWRISGDFEFGPLSGCGGRVLVRDLSCLQEVNWAEDCPIIPMMSA